MTAEKKIELLAPAGNFEKLEIAIHYGADAVYLAGKDFSLRNFSGNFTLDEMQSAVTFAHQKGVKVYTACNIYPRTFEEKAIAEYLHKIGEIGPDALIIADPGVFDQARQVIPQIPVHLSTQANTTSYQSVRFWENLGVKRVNLARELSLEEIKEIASCCLAEIETFVHGAMCISYSGRCLLSSFMTHRDSNRGMCSHPCRWKYSVVEELRPGLYHPLAEDDRGAYVFNSKDLCMIGHIPELMESGIASFKIEGRMKGINYLAATVKTYREAIDAYYEDPEGYCLQKEWLKELTQISHRNYCTGFYFQDPDTTCLNYENEKPSAINLFIAKVREKAGPQSVTIDVRNKIVKGDGVEVLTQKGPARPDRIREIIDLNGRPLPVAQPNSRVTIVLDNDYAPNDLIRRVEAGMGSAEGAH